MSIMVDGMNVSTIHVRYDGRSYGIRVKEMADVNNDMNKSDFFTAVENYLDLAEGSLSGYELDIVEETQNGVIRPKAKFGG